MCRWNLQKQCMSQIQLRRVFPWAYVSLTAFRTSGWNCAEGPSCQAQTQESEILMLDCMLPASSRWSLLQGWKRPGYISQGICTPLFQLLPYMLGSQLLLADMGHPHHLSSWLRPAASDKWGGCYVFPTWSDSSWQPIMAEGWLTVTDI